MTITTSGECYNRASKIKRFIQAMTKPEKDKVYASPMTSIEAFSFDAAVADVFQDMIERSVSSVIS